MIQYRVRTLASLLNDPKIDYLNKINKDRLCDVPQTCSSVCIKRVVRVSGLRVIKINHTIPSTGTKEWYNCQLEDDDYSIDLQYYLLESYEISIFNYIKWRIGHALYTLWKRLKTRG